MHSDVDLIVYGSAVRLSVSYFVLFELNSIGLLFWSFKFSRDLKATGKKRICRCRNG